MTKHRVLLVAGAVAAALAAPHAVAQSGTDPYRTSSHSWWGERWFGGWFNNRANQGAWINTDPDRYDGSRNWYPHPRAHIGPDNAYHSPTDGDSGGAGIPAPNGVVPSTSPLVSSGEPPYPPSRLAAGGYREGRAGPAQSESTDPQQNPQRSATDGRSGGTGVPSSTSGAVPSTQPQEDARDRSTTTGTYRADPMRRDSTSGADGVTSNAERSLTDGRSGGTNLPSPQSGATPSTSPTTIR